MTTRNWSDIRDELDKLERDLKDAQRGTHWQETDERLWELIDTEGGKWL